MACGAVCKGGGQAASDVLRVGALLLAFGLCHTRRESVMRADAKLGIVISGVVVLVAGVYFMYRDTSEVPIPVGSSSGSLSDVFEPEPSQPQESAAKKPAPKLTKSSPGNQPNVGQSDPAKGRSGNALALRRLPNQTSATKKFAVGKAVTTDAFNQALASGDNTSGTGANRSLNLPSQPKYEGTARDSRPVVTELTDTVRKGRTRDAKAKPVVNERMSLTGTTPQPRRPAGKDFGAAVESHKVQSGDTLSSLAERYYGSSVFSSYLFECNSHLKSPDQLSIGTIIWIPPKPTPDGVAPKRSASGHRQAPRTGASRTTPKASTGRVRTYHVQPGDSLYAIAQRVLGNGNRWKELYELNKNVIGSDSSKLKVGQRLRLPPR